MKYIIIMGLSVLSLGRDMCSMAPALKLLDAHMQQLQVKMPLTLTHWYLRCKDLVYSESDGHAQISASEFEAALREYQKLQLQFFSEVPWASEEKITTAAPADEFQTCAQKTILARGDYVYFFGDLHGDIQSLVYCLKEIQRQGDIDDTFKLEKNRYIIFLGDYIDRGVHGIEILYTILRLKIRNPHQVFMVRGNHENPLEYNRYGFERELFDKFTGRAEVLSDEIARVFNLLPVVLYVGIPNAGGKNYSYLHCCHGYIEMGYNPAKKLFNTVLKQGHASVCERIVTLQQRTHFSEMVACMPEAAEYEKRSTSEERAVSKQEKSKHLQDMAKTLQMTVDPEKVFTDGEPITSGNNFMWGDCTAMEDTAITQKSSRGSSGLLSFGSGLSEPLLRYQSTDEHRIVATVRGHQHNKSMIGLLDCRNKSVYYLPWEQPVYTTVATKQFGRPDHCVFTFVRIGFESADPVAWKVRRFSYELRAEPVGWDISKKVGLYEWKNIGDSTGKTVEEYEKGI